MTTLRIEHTITDFTDWKEAFDRFADARSRAGVRHHRIHQSQGDQAYIYVDLDFDDAESAERFLVFLQSTVWSQPENSPALVGAPVTHLLELVDQS